MFLTVKIFYKVNRYSKQLIYTGSNFNQTAFFTKMYTLRRTVTLFIHTLFQISVSQSVQSLSPVWLFATPWTTARQASLSITNSRSPLKLMSIESVMPSNHLILHHPLLLPPSIPPSIRVFSNESTLRIRWPMYWSFSFSISPSNEHPGLISFRMDWLEYFTFCLLNIFFYSSRVY